MRGAGRAAAAPYSSTNDASCWRNVHDTRVPVGVHSCVLSLPTLLWPAGPPQSLILPCCSCPSPPRAYPCSQCMPGTNWPCNLVMLVLFTTSVGVETSHIVLHVGNPPLLLSSLGVTLAIFATLSFTALTAREDFSFLGTWLLTSLVGFVLLTLAQLVLHSEWMHMAIAWVGTALFSGYVVYDTSNLVHLYGPEEGVDAAIGALPGRPESVSLGRAGAGGEQRLAAPSLLQGRRITPLLPEHIL